MRARVRSLSTPATSSCPSFTQPHNPPSLLHTLPQTQLPSAAEAALGATLYSKFLIEQHAKRTLLDKQHKDTLLVTAVAQKLIAALGQGRGGGYQKHLRSFRWEVAVVDQPVMNAFVFPGGKICVYTGLLDLLKRDETLLAMVMG